MPIPAAPLVMNRTALTPPGWGSSGSDPFAVIELAECDPLLAQRPMSVMFEG
jgi:hypothetical protein